MNIKTFTVLESENVANIANTLFHRLGQPLQKITPWMVWQVVHALNIETPICRNCDLKQKMIFEDRGEHSVYYCPNCQEEIDFGFWLNGMYTKNGRENTE